VIKDTVTKDERRRKILAEAVERFDRQIMDDEERQVVLHRIKRIRRALEEGQAYDSPA
jgi:uncharacterized protein (UPF0248 family)